MSTENIDVSQISSADIRASLVQFIEKYVKSQNIKVCIERGSKKGDNFIGSIFRVLYEKTDSNEDQKSFILKIASQNEIRRATMGLHKFFSREIYMYTKVLPLFKEFQLTKGISIEQDGFNEYAKCYHSVDTEMSECLLLEDLCRKQMEMINFRTTLLTYEHVALVMKALGKFHALSFALKDQQPLKFKQLTKELTELFYKVDGDFEVHTENLLKFIFESLERSNRSDLIEKMRNATKGGFLKNAIHTVSSEAAGQYAVICHGDAWVNNCMYRSNEQGIPVAVNLIDWQFSRYASPVTDVVIHLLCCTTQKLRNERYDDLLKVYYDSFSHLLKMLGSDPEKLFPIDIFLSEMKKFGKYAGFVGAFLCMIMTGDTEKMPDMDDPVINGFEDAHTSQEATQALDAKILDLYGDLALYGYI